MNRDVLQDEEEILEHGDTNLQVNICSTDE